MLSEKDLRELINYTTEDPVVSVYLNTDPSEGNADTHKRKLRSMIRRLTPPMISRLSNSFLSMSTTGLGAVAVFSQPQNFFSRLSPSVPVRNLVHISEAGLRQPQPY